MTNPAVWLALAAAVVTAPPMPLAGGRATRRARTSADTRLPLILDLVAAVLRSGRPLADALALAAPAGDGEVAAALVRVAALARLGADPADAWAALPRDGPLADVIPVAVRSATSGVRLAAAFERLAEDLRADRTAAASARAQRVGVAAVGPLAACFLPSFVCLGIVPVVVQVARQALGGLP